MSTGTQNLRIERDAPIPTWFRIGGGAKRLARPESVPELVACLEIDDEFKVLGEGANLLVDDDGISRLVVSLKSRGFKQVEIDPATGVVRAGAGVSLPGLISRCVRDGVGGLEALSGIPATVGGAAIMNAGGSFGSFSDLVLAVHAIDRAGREHTYERAQIDYNYRQSHLNHLIVTEVVLQLTPTDREDLRRRRAECMEYKVGSQPLGEKSAGCVFKNPTLLEPIEGIGGASERVSAGMLIDRAGCKGMSVGGATVSHLHANFITTTADAHAHEVIELIAQVRERVYTHFGVSLHNELVIWSDHPLPESPDFSPGYGGHA